MSEWLVCVLLVFMWAHGFITAWAAAHDHEPFWRAYNDVWALCWHRIKQNWRGSDAR